jgi:hypothetical protein
MNLSFRVSCPERPASGRASTHVSRVSLHGSRGEPLRLKGEPLRLKGEPLRLKGELPRHQGEPPRLQSYRLRDKDKPLLLQRQWPLAPHCKDTIPKVRIKYSQKRNCAAPCYSPNSYTHVSVSDLYISLIGLPIHLQDNRWTELENI